MGAKKLNKKLGYSIDSFRSLIGHIRDIVSMGVFFESKGGNRGRTEEPCLNIMSSFDCRDKTVDVYLETFEDIFL